MKRQTLRTTTERRLSPVDLSRIAVITALIAALGLPGAFPIFGPVPITAQTLGVMLAGAALKYLQRHSVAPGREVVIATNNDSAYEVAIALLRENVPVKALLDSRRLIPSELAETLRVAGVRVGQPKRQRLGQGHAGTSAS